MYSTIHQICIIANRTNGKVKDDIMIHRQFNKSPTLFQLYISNPQERKHRSIEKHLVLLHEIKIFITQMNNKQNEIIPRATLGTCQVRP